MDGQDIDSVLSYLIYLMDLPVRSGSIHSRLIGSFNESVGLPSGSPWAASCISFCFSRLAGPASEITGHFPYSGSVEEILRWFVDKGLTADSTKSLWDWDGALVVWMDPDLRIAAVCESRGRTVEVLEPGAKVTLGTGIVQRELPMSGPKLTFLNVSRFVGGNFWHPENEIEFRAGGPLPRS